MNPSAILRMRTPPAAAGAFRASGVIPTAANVSSQVVTFPASAVAGDYMIIFATHGFPTNIPTGWTNINQPGAGSDCNGATFGKALTSGDISTGSVTVTFTGSAPCVIGYVVFAGGVTGVRTTQSVRGATPAPTPRTLTTSSAPVSGDVTLYWGSDGTNTAPTIDRGSTLQTVNAATGFSARLNSEVLGSSGAITANFAYPAGTVNGDYDLILVMQP